MNSGITTWNVKEGDRVRYTKYTFAHTLEGAVIDVFGDYLGVKDLDNKE